MKKKVFTARRYASVVHAVVVCLSYSGIVSQEALLWQRDCAMRLSVEILQLQVQLKVKSEISFDVKSVM